MKIVKNLRCFRVWTTNIFVLCLLYQLVLATPTGQDSVVTLNETQTEQTNMETLTKEMDLLKSKLITVKNLTEHNVGIFHNGSSRSPSNITQIERKMLQIQNRIRELSNITDSGISDVASIKQRMNTLETELEELRRLYDDDGREVRQDFGKFTSLLANLTQAHNQLSDQLLRRINELEYNLNYHIQREVADFHKAMEAKNFSWAAVNFNKIIRKNEIVKFIKRSYQIVNNFECYMKLASQFVLCEKRQEIYSVIKDNFLLQKNESYVDFCRYATILHLMFNTVVESSGKLIYDFTTGVVWYAKNKCVVSDRERRPNYDHHLSYLRRAYETAIDTLLPPLLQRNRHTAVNMIVINRDYLISYVRVNYKNGQTLYCEKNEISLIKDNYVAPIDNC